MKRNAAAVWQGGLKDGGGTMSTESGTLSQAQYSFGTRFEQGTGTNPEELLGAAHAGCYSMALSLVLGESGITPERDDQAFQDAANAAKAGCPVSKLFNAEITLQARLA